jgi:hypothetical protein
MSRLVRGWQALMGMGRRSEVWVWTIVVVLLGVVTFGAVAAPRMLRDAERLSLAEAIDDAPIGARQLVVRVLDDYPPGDDADPLELQERRLAEISDEIPGTVLDRFVDARFVADTARFSVAYEAVEPVATDPAGPAVPDPAATGTEPALPTFMTFRVHPELDAHSELVAGRAAAGTDRVVNGMRVLEFELAAESADELGWELGELVMLTVDPSDLVTRSFNRGLPADFVAELVGLRELDRATDRYWFGDPRLHRPTVADTSAGANVFAYAILEAAQLPTAPFFVDGRSPFALEQRRDLDPGAITLESVDELLAGVLGVEASFSNQPTLTRPGVVTGLRPVLETEIGQRDAARTTLGLAAAAVLGVVLTTLGQLLVAAAGRRRGWLTVARARGASRPQVLVAAMSEMAVLATVATLLGGGVALLVAPSVRADLEVPLVLATWLGAVLCAGVIAWSEGMRPVTVSGRPNAHPGLGRWGRIAGVVLVAVAAGALVTFRRRGVALDGPRGEAGDALDPLVVLLPVLVPLAVVFVTKRAVPWLLGRLATRGLRLGPGRLVGLRRVAGSPDATIGIVTVIVLALTVAALGVGVDRSLEGGAVDASWSAVGAPYRVDTRFPEVRDRIAELPDTTVAASGSTRVNVERDGDSYGTNLITVDVADLGAITAGTVADEELPAELTAVRLDGSIPVVASARVNGRLVRVGDRFEGIGSRSAQVFHVIGIEGAVFGRDNDFLVADRRVIADVGGFEPGFNTVAVDAPPSARAGIERIAAASGDEVLVRDDVLAAQLDDPLSRAVRRGFLLAAGFALLLSLVGLTAVAVVTARQRQREVAILGLLGAGGREAANAVVAELAPAALTGTVVGTVVGWFVARSYDGRFDLSAFAAGTPVSIRVDTVGLLVAAGAVAVASLLVIAVLVRRIVTVRATDILRIDGAA